MKGDFSRHTFQPGKNYSAVLLQQGRALLDADFNEQGAIGLRLIRALAADLIGPHGGPGEGFRLTAIEGDPASLAIAGGHYYVDGLLVDANRPEPPRPVGGPEPEPGAGWTYWDQPWAYLDPEDPDDELPARPPYVLCLKVWEDLVTAAEDPEIRETALGSALPDTAARSRVFWQVLPARGLDLSGVKTADAVRERFAGWAGERTGPSSRLAARTERPARTEEDPCIVAPDSRYRGQENQLYRVEVHGDRTFKWSRDNGSVTFPIAAVDGDWVTLAALGRDDKLDLHVGDAVEVADDASVARGVPGKLLRVEDVDVPDRRVQLSGEPGPGAGRIAARHPLLRRWDHPRARDEGPGDGAVEIVEGEWLSLENGVQVWFEPGGVYRTGDYWLIAARTLTGDVEWPRDDEGRPLLRPPAGVTFHYAPLAWAHGDGDPEDLRLTFEPLTRRPAP
ncbi:DUF6519 domain-containing protein [Actinoplanes sp. NPDC000266]